MKNGIFSHDIDAARLFDKKVNAKRSAWHYGAEVLEFKPDRDVSSSACGGRSGLVEWL